MNKKECRRIENDPNFKEKLRTNFHLEYLKTRSSVDRAVATFLGTLQPLTQQEANLKTFEKVTKGRLVALCLDMLRKSDMDLPLQRVEWEVEFYHGRCTSLPHSDIDLSTVDF
jgi:hypothetical protein